MQKYRSPKEFSDTHRLIMHTYNYSDSADLLVDHLGLHKALCVLFGWNHLMPPDNSRVYQSLSAEEAAANQDDLIMWPPLVIIHNTITGKGRDGRMDGLGNKAMDSKLRGIKCLFIFLFLYQYNVSLRCLAIFIAILRIFLCYLLPLSISCPSLAHYDIVHFGADPSWFCLCPKGLLIGRTSDCTYTAHLFVSPSPCGTNTHNVYPAST